MYQYVAAKNCYRLSGKKFILIRKKIIPIETWRDVISVAKIVS